MKVCIIFVLFIIYLLRNCYCQRTVTTYPMSINGETPIVPAVENTNDITVVCVILFNGNPFITGWQITKSGGSETLLAFSLNGTGNNPDSSNFFVTGEPSIPATTQSNFTILTFDSSLDMATLDCLDGNEVVGSFFLRIISKSQLHVCCVLCVYLKETSVSA